MYFDMRKNIKYLLKCLREKYIHYNNIDIINIPKNINLDGLKIVLSGIDDSIKDFKVSPDAIKTITYVPNLSAYGEMQNNGNMRISKKSMGSYGTGVHETVHALDFYETKKMSKQYSSKIIEDSRKELKIRNNSKEYVKYRTEIANSYFYDDYEVLAYSIEKEYKTNEKINQLSEKIYRNFMEDRK